MSLRMNMLNRFAKLHITVLSYMQRAVLCLLRD